MPLLELWAHQSECGEQLHHGFDHYLVHYGHRVRHLSIYSETADPIFNRLEHLGEDVGTRDYAIGRLIDLVVRGISTYEPSNDTYVQ